MGPPTRLEIPYGCYKTYDTTRLLSIKDIWWATTARDAARKIFGALAGTKLRLGVSLHAVGLCVFIVYLLIRPDDLVAILGTLVFTVGATLLATLKFSKDLGESTARQVSALRDISKAEVEAAQARSDETDSAMREVSEQQANALADRLDRMIALLEAVSQSSLRSTEEAEKIRKQQEELVREQQRFRLEEEARRQVERAGREKTLMQKRPKVRVRIVEKPLFIFGFIRDFWLEITNESSLKELRVAGRSLSRTRGMSGTWRQWSTKDLSLPRQLDTLNFGDIGVRGVHDEVEVHVEALNGEDERFAATIRMSLQATLRWTEIPLKPAL